MDSFYLCYRDHMYQVSSKSGSEPFSFALLLDDLRWNDPLLKHTKKLGECYFLFFSEIGLKKIQLQTLYNI